MKGTEIAIKASLDPAKLAGSDRAVRAGYQGVHVSIKVHADATPEQLEKLRAEVETRCPVSDNIAQPTPVQVSLTAA